MSDHRRDATAAPPRRQAPSDAAPAERGAERAPERPSERPSERIAKALARAGVASRREVERYIAEGRVALNGRVLDTPAVKVEPGDMLTVDGRPVDAAEAVRVWRYHKPVGLVTSNGDPQGRPTVFAALPPGMPRVISVGRLDLNSEGLLLLTNDGELARALELPSGGWTRRYRARCFGRTTPEKLDALKEGVTVEGVRYGAIEARLDKATGAGAKSEGAAPANLWISVSLTEGKNREVRRVLESIGLKVNRLIRLAHGPFALATLGVGEVEEVGPRVIREQLEGLVPPERMPRGERAAPRPVPHPEGSAPARHLRRRAPAEVPATGATEGARPAAAAKPARAKARRPGAKVVAPPPLEYKPGWAKPSRPFRHKATGGGRAAAVPTETADGRPIPRPRGPAKAGAPARADAAKRSGPAPGAPSRPPAGGPRPHARDKGARGEGAPGKEPPRGKGPRGPRR